MRTIRKFEYINQFFSNRRNKIGWICLNDSKNELEIGRPIDNIPDIGKASEFKLGTRINVIIEEPEGNPIIKKDKTHLCDVCNQNESVVISSIPGIPYSAAYCQNCLNANAHPWDILVSNVACIGGLDKSVDFMKEMVECTCKHLNKTINEFNNDVNKNISFIEKCNTTL